VKIRRIAITVVFLIVASAAGLGWFRYVAHTKPVACGYCNRPLHENLTVTAVIGGKKTQACCARCAISEANQQHESLHLVSVRDYVSGRTISPSDAWFVEGSSVMACDHDAMRMNEMKGTQELAFDRCSPGTFAFADRRNADSFTIKNGGTVMSFAQLMNEARFQ